MEDEKEKGWVRTLIEQKLFWYFIFFAAILWTGFANAEDIISGAERIIRAWRGTGG